MKNFNTFFEAAEDKAMQEPERVSDDAVALFGRHQPPHLGHALTFGKANDLAEEIGADQTFFSSRSQDAKQNPLPFLLKMMFLKKMFPEHADKWDGDENIRTVLGAAQKLNNKGYKNLHLISGGDRQQQMEDLLRKYNGDLYNFENVYTHSAGDRDIDPEDFIGNLSGSGMRKMALGDNFESFSQGLPIGENFTKEDAQQLFNMIKTFSQVNEEWETDYRGHSDYIRSLYRDGVMFNEGDIVESLSTGLIGEVHRCGTNHLICITGDGIMFKSFVHDVQAI